MNNLAVTWSADKYKELEAHLTGFWAENVWDMKKCPAPTRPPRINEACHLKFFCPSITVNNEIKYALWRKFTAREWDGLGLVGSFSPLLKWLRNDFPPGVHSLIQKSIVEWEGLLISYLIKEGKTVKQGSYTYISRTRGLIRYPQHPTSIALLRKIYKVISDFYDPRSEYEKDVWSLDKLSIARSPSHSSHSINFQPITQIWLSAM